MGPNRVADVVARLSFVVAFVSGAGCGGDDNRQRADSADASVDSEAFADSAPAEAERDRGSDASSSGFDAGGCSDAAAPCGTACCARVPLATGDAHSCAITAGAGVVCWGWNYGGQLGDGTTKDRPAPVAVVGLGSGVVALTAGVMHTCALTNAGTVMCWGNDSFGQLGDGRTIGVAAFSDVPVAVLGLPENVVAIAAATYTTCAVTADGGVWCWGPDSLGNGVGGPPSSIAVATLAPGSGVKAITAGAGFFCATTSGSVLCWGTTHFGVFDNAMTESQLASPTPSFAEFSPPLRLSANDRNMCAITPAGGVVCLGDDTYGQLGSSAILPSATAFAISPRPVSGLSGVLGLSVGSQALHACAWTQSALWCWGSNSDGQTGSLASNADASTVPSDADADAEAPILLVATPTAVASLPSDLVWVATGDEHTCAMTREHVYCWGSNEVGQLGMGVVTSGSVTPVAVMGL